jgi:hypothetical protein
MSIQIVGLKQPQLRTCGKSTQPLGLLSYCLFKQWENIGLFFSHNINVALSELPDVGTKSVSSSETV